MLLPWEGEDEFSLEATEVDYVSDEDLETRFAQTPVAGPQRPQETVLAVPEDAVEVPGTHVQEVLPEAGEDPLPRPEPPSKRFAAMERPLTEEPDRPQVEEALADLVAEALRGRPDERRAGETKEPSQQDRRGARREARREAKRKAKREAKVAAQQEREAVHASRREVKLRANGGPGGQPEEAGSMEPGWTGADGPGAESMEPGWTEAVGPEAESMEPEAESMEPGWTEAGEPEAESMEPEAESMEPGWTEAGEPEAESMEPGWTEAGEPEAGEPEADAPGDPDIGLALPANTEHTHRFKDGRKQPIKKQRRRAAKHATTTSKELVTTATPESKELVTTATPESEELVTAATPESKELVTTTKPGRKKLVKAQHGEQKTLTEAASTDSSLTVVPPRNTSSRSNKHLASYHAPPAWGLKRPAGGRVSHVAAGPEFQATSTQACGLFPFLAGSGSPSKGVPIGRHMYWGESVGLDPLQWLEAGLVTNPGIMILGAPGTGKSSLIKRLMRGMAGFGVRPFVLGDLKPDYTAIVERLGGQVVRVGRGLDRINPLDTGPLGQAAARIPGAAGEQLRAEARGRRLNALLALLTLVRKSPITNVEENILSSVVDLLDARAARSGGRLREPTVADVLQVLRTGDAIEELVLAADARNAEQYQDDTRALRQTLNLLLAGSLKGVFDDHTTHPIDLNAPAVAVDISAVASAGDTLVAAAMLSTWAYGFSLIDGSAAMAEHGLAPRRQYLVVMDELWRALRGSPGLVEHADALTRVNRAKGVADVRATHSLADLEALPTEEDRAKARGFVERAGITILAGLSPRELDKVAEVVPLSEEERTLVASWCAPESWTTSGRHPGRGKYLLKAGARVGIPVDLTYVGDEAQLYDTDARIRRLDVDVPNEPVLGGFLGDGSGT